ncbi:hypothetical protein [Cellulomonas phragmiteti]|uniref:Uncharacterized protein n=1 Tax=Cellulomonas phragmiteti TaxID=478780 RepID=A0ABQ4DQQ5_9CELL|nr:hypothetical protein [Cellulomonas phragmiteti]GIG41659.1 hypothetical protein Cph01nite_34210 [Cellulomonas phragmiteti]
MSAHPTGPDPDQDLPEGVDEGTPDVLAKIVDPVPSGDDDGHGADGAGDGVVP